jgi:hypothetical protein
MDLIVATWPDNSVSVLRAPAGWDALWLFDALDQESGPLDAQVFIVKGRNARIGWYPEGGRRGDDEKLVPYAYSGRLVGWEWPSDMLDQWAAMVREWAKVAK